MPHLQYCNRLWYIGGDELCFPITCNFVGRIVWTSVYIALLIISYKVLLSCNKADGWIILSYFICAIVAYIIAGLCDLSIVFISLKGTMVSDRKRALLLPLFNLRMIMVGFQGILSVFGLLLAATTINIKCSDEFNRKLDRRSLLMIVSIIQILDLMIFVCCSSCLLTSKTEKAASNREEHEIVDWWQRKFRNTSSMIYWLCCNLFGGHEAEEGFEETAKAMTNLFHHDGFLDVVPSDIVAGFILVSVEQKSFLNRKETDEVKHDEENPSSNPQASRRVSSISEHTKESIDIPILTRCSVFALGMYTQLMLLYTNPCASNARLCRCPLLLCTCCLSSVTAMASPLIASRSSSFSQHDEAKGAANSGLSFSSQSSEIINSGFTSQVIRDSDEANRNHEEKKFAEADEGGNTRTKLMANAIVGDNCCRVNVTNLNSITRELDSVEVVYISFENNVNQKPFGIFVDHKLQWVVIALRGTVSMEDCMTDVNFDAIELEDAGKRWGFQGKDKFAHTGMLKSALYLREEIERLGLLRRAFGQQQLNPQHSMTTPLHRDYAQYAHYSLVVTGHSLGAGTAILLAMMLKPQFPHLQCMVYGTPGAVLDKATCREVEPYVTSVVLNDDLISRLSFRSLCALRNDVLDAISRAKVNKMTIFRSIFKREVTADELMFERGEEPPSEFKNIVQKFKDDMQQRIDALCKIEMSVPGKIVHIIKTHKVKRWCRSKSFYSARRASLEDFEEIIVSATMASDHMPDKYYDTMHELLAEYQREE